MAVLTPRFLVRAAAAVVATVLTLAPVRAQQSQAGEHALKAAFLYNFTKFIDWPDSAFTGSTAPFQVCVLADEAFRRAVENILQGEEKRGHRFAVSVPQSTDNVRTCHLMYFGVEEGERWAARLPALRQTPVLTVGEGPRFLDRGGLIAFLLVGDRVRFDIRKQGAEQAGLNVSAKLLRVARQVVQGPPAP